MKKLLKSIKSIFAVLQKLVILCGVTLELNRVSNYVELFNSCKERGYSYSYLLCGTDQQPFAAALATFILHTIAIGLATFLIYYFLKLPVNKPSAVKE